MKRSVLLLSLAALALVFSFSSPASAQKVYEMNICYLSPDTDPIGMGWLALKETLEKKSEGRIKVNLYPNKLVSNSDRESAEKVQAGIVQVVSVPTSSVAALANIKEYKVFDYAYLFDNNEEVFSVIDGPIGKDLSKMVEKKAGVKPVGAYILGWLVVSTNKKPVESPADLKGLKIRTMNSDLQMEAIRSFGGNPTIINFGELFTACQQGTVDGMMTTPGLYVSDRFYEVQKHMGVVNVSPLLHIVLVNADWYNALPKDLQKAFDESIPVYQEAVRRFEAEDERTAFEKLRAGGMTVNQYTPEQKKAFSAATSHILGDPKMQEIAGKEIIDKVRKQLGK